MFWSKKEYIAIQWSTTRKIQECSYTKKINCKKLEILEIIENPCNANKRKWKTNLCTAWWDRNCNWATAIAWPPMDFHCHITIIQGRAITCAWMNRGYRAGRSSWWAVVYNVMGDEGEIPARLLRCWICCNGGEERLDCCDKRWHFRTVIEFCHCWTWCVCSWENATILSKLRKPEGAVKEGRWCAGCIVCKFWKWGYQGMQETGRKTW